MWAYEPTDGMNALFGGSSSSSADTSKSISALTKGGKDSEKLLKTFDNKLKSSLFTVKIGDWFRADSLVIKSVDYRVKTSVFGKDGNPEYLMVTMNLAPVRKLSSSEIRKWFPKL